MAKREKWKFKLKQAMDPELARVLAHPLRGHILVTVNERIASPVEIARETGASVTMVSNQMSELETRDLVSLVEIKPRRGAGEHFYRPSTQLVFDDREWRQLPKSVRPSLSIDLLELIGREVVEAIDAGTFDARNRHLSRITLLLDEQGWRDLMRVQEKALREMMTIREECARRLKGREGAWIPAIAVMAGFERAPDRSSDQSEMEGLSG